jgi:hypothetical protein
MQARSIRWMLRQVAIPRHVYHQDKGALISVEHEHTLAFDQHFFGMPLSGSHGGGEDIGLKVSVVTLYPRVRAGPRVIPSDQSLD